MLLTLPEVNTYYSILLCGQLQWPKVENELVPENVRHPSPLLSGSQSIVFLAQTNLWNM